MTQLPLNFDSHDATERDSHVDVWIWLSYMTRVEMTPLEYQWPPPTGEALEETNARLEMLETAGDRFMAKAAEVAGESIDEDRWQRAMQRFDGGF